MSDLEGATSPGDPAAYPSTPGEFAARWNAMPEDVRATFVRGLAAESEKAQLCRLLHDGVRFIPRTL